MYYFFIKESIIFSDFVKVITKLFFKNGNARDFRFTMSMLYLTVKIAIKTKFIYKYIIKYMHIGNAHSMWNMWNTKKS